MGHHETTGTATANPHEHESTLHEALRDARGRVEDAADGLRDQADRGRDRVAGMADEIGDRVPPQAFDVMHAMRRFVRQRPMLAVAIALAVGLRLAMMGRGDDDD